MVNRTPGDEVPAGLEVTLLVGRGAELLWQRTVRAGEDGRFEFSGVPTAQGRSYAFEVEYQGAPYRRTFDQGLPAGPVELPVFSATASTADVHVLEDVLLLPRIASDPRALVALEMVTLGNEGRHTVVPDLSRAGQDVGLLRFSLPEGARELDVRTSLPGGRVVQLPVGFALTAPVPPGEHEVLFSYEIPYREGAIEFPRVFPLGARSFRVLLNSQLGRLAAPGLSDLGTIDMGERSYRAAGLDAIERGSRLSWRLEGLPSPSLLDRLDRLLTSASTPGAAGGIVGGMLLMILAYALLARWRAGQGPPGEMPDGTAALIREIARLDARFEKGEIEPAPYHREREALRARVSEATRRQAQGREES